jgi:hypothetical protein
MPFSSETFLLEEYKALRKEVEIYLLESRSLERYTIIAVGIIWGWLINTHNHNRMVWAIPVVLTALATVRRFAIDRHFNRLRDYIVKTEADFQVNGWEHGWKHEEGPEEGHGWKLWWKHWKHWWRRAVKNRQWNIADSEKVVSFILVALSIIGFFLRAALTQKR